MNLDIRLPIGALFTLLGLLLTAWGVMGDAADYRRSLGHNVNLWWGLVVLAFGLLFLWMGRKGTSGARPAETETMGRETEAREHRLGLEHD
jgi:hypothetical protein